MTTNARVGRPGEDTGRHLVYPRDVNHWVIPGGVIVTVLLWVGTVIHLAGHTLDEKISTTTSLFVSATVAASVICVLYAKDHATQRACARNQYLLRAELREIRDIAESTAGHQTALLEQITGQLDAAKDSYWVGVAAGCSDTGRSANVRELRDRRS